MGQGGGAARGTAAVAHLPIAVRSQRVPDVDIYPYSAVGRLRCARAGRPHLATACVVAGPGGRPVVYTSAAGLWAEGGWSTDIAFELRYDAGDFAGPYTPRPGSLWVPDSWRVAGATTTFDLGTFEPVPDLPPGQPLLHPRSVLGVAWQGLTATAIGYGGPDEQGRPDPQHMYMSTGRVEYLFPFLGQLGSDLGDGAAAGGPWLVDLGQGPSMVGGTGLILAEFETLVSPPFIPLVVPFLDLPDTA